MERRKQSCKVDCLEEVRQWHFKSTTCSITKRPQKILFEIYITGTSFEEYDLNIPGQTQRYIVLSKIESTIPPSIWANIVEDMDEEEM